MLDDLTTSPVPPTDDPLLDEPLDDEGAVPPVDPLESLEEAVEAEAVDPDADAADVV